MRPGLINNEFTYHGLSPPILRFLCLLDLCARNKSATRAQHFLSVWESISSYTCGKLPCTLALFAVLGPVRPHTIKQAQPRGGSAGIRNLYSYVTFSGDIRYDNRSYAAFVQPKELCQRADFGTICSNLCLCERPILQDMCSSGSQESTQPLRPLVLSPSSCENAVICAKDGSTAWSLRNW